MDDDHFSPPAYTRGDEEGILSKLLLRKLFF